MEKALLLYSSTDGQTIKIINHMKATLSTTFECEVIDLHTATNLDFSLYSRVIVGGSIRYGHLNKKLYQFIEQYQQILTEKEAGFFCVNLTARKKGKNKPETNAYMQKFLQKSPWTPKYQSVIAGALFYPRYSWFDRFMIRLIMKITGGETDTTKEVEYTDWNEVTRFADMIKNS
ncbi:menaquinone-dependent protoporphyrinogen IX dehydrogenase [Vibrio sp. SS-MA-C1-2]|uniref:menaquinone-dependent protoporphyrinogen IX dehydrogenase n=1 Tax=Vibrio sp. SS-MA-C1-2 TaxID=2908646 RepID=UPI001F213C30|nr:menaquinone-dependent protoporphyrinogen IX dehydrogenase [Vibrio sp. SS-MA-C1-2]UJF19313.1 menaquinone-dependent protoporphyrinogen IX dehydrogenase [Vibrio sp. SS-MA-C1-2]